MDSVNATKLYDGDGGNAQTEFILDSEVGWEQVVNNPNLSCCITSCTDTRVKLSL